MPSPHGPPMLSMSSPHMLPNVFATRQSLVWTSMRIPPTHSRYRCLSVTGIYVGSLAEPCHRWSPVPVRMLCGVARCSTTMPSLCTWPCTALQNAIPRAPSLWSWMSWPTVPRVWLLEQQCCSPSCPRWDLYMYHLCSNLWHRVLSRTIYRFG